VRTRISATGSRRRALRLRAFTLIELVVVLVLLTVAAGLIVPRMGRSLGQRELRESAARFAHTARTVRELAVSRHRICAIELDLDAGAYGVTWQSGSSSDGKLQTIRASWLKQGRWPESVRVTGYRTPTGVNAVTGLQQVKFMPDGTSSGASIRLEGGDETCSVVICPHNGAVVFGDEREIAGASGQYDLGD